LNAFAAMETTGLYVDDEDALPKFQAYMTEVVANQKASLLKQVPKEIKREHLDMPNQRGKDPADVLSFTRDSFLKDILFTHPKGFKLVPQVFTKSTANLPDEYKEPSVSSKQHLPYFFDRVPFTVELAEHVKDARLLGTNIIG